MAKVRPLNDALQKAAIDQLNEVPERVPDDIAALRTWIQQQPYLKARTDDQFLLSFLRGCKFSLEKAKSKIDKYYTLRTKFPDLFTPLDVDDPKFREILRLGAFLYLPTPLNQHGPRISIIRNGVTDPGKYSIQEVSRVMSALQEIVMLEDDYATVYGIVHILDMAKATTAHFFQMTPTVMKQFAVYSEEALPFRQRGSHFINTFSGFEPTFNLLKPMLTQKQQRRLHVHGKKMELLQEQIPKEYLPKEYGGENGSFDEITAYWERKVDEYREHFKENPKYCTDESLRPGKPINFDNIFGVEGSFRKLNVD